MIKRPALDARAFLAERKNRAIDLLGLAVEVLERDLVERWEERDKECPRPEVVDLAL